MSFARPELLWLLLAVPALFGCARLARDARRRLLAPFARVASGLRGPRQVVLPAAVLALLVLALAGPRWGERLAEVPVEGIDIVVVLDASRSMRVRDVYPDRLSRARRELIDLAGRFEGGRLALVTCGGSGELVCPLTLDRVGFTGFVRDVDPALTPRGGTNLEAGLRRALEVFDAESPARRVILLVSDGENLSGDPGAGAAGWLAYSRGVVVHSLLVGTETGGPIPVGPGRGDGYITDAAGEIVLSAAAPTFLEQTARRTGGQFLAADREPFPLARLVEERLADVRLTGSGTMLRREPVDRYQWFLLPAVLVLLAGLGRRPPRVVFAGSVLLAVAWSGAEDSARRGVRKYEAGDYAAAAELFERAAGEAPERAAFAYNLAVASYAAGDYRRATRTFDRSRSLAQGDLRARSAFGAGVARARQAFELARLAGNQDRPLIGQAVSLLIAARKDFVEALVRGAGEEAAINLELASRKLEELLELQLEAGGSDASGTGREETTDADDADGPTENRAPDATEPGTTDAAEQEAADESTAAERSAGESAADGDLTARLPGGIFREEAVDIEEVVKRYERERLEYDRRRARTARSKTERDW